MSSPRQTRKKWITWIAALGGAAALLLALLLLAGGRGLSARFDNPEDILSSYDPASFPALALAEDGSALLRLTRDDFYYYARSAGLLGPLRETLRSRGCTAAGLRLGDGGVTICARCRSLGFLTLTYKARCAVTWADGRLILTPEKIWLGNALVLSEKRWPELFRQELSVDPGPVGQSVLEAAVRGEALEVRLAGLGETLRDSYRRVIWYEKINYWSG